MPSWLSPIIGAIAGGGIFAIFKYIFFQVGSYERAVLTRLGKPVLRHSKKLGKNVQRILSPGRMAAWVPFLYKPLKISVAIRVMETPEIKMMRYDPEWKE